MERLQTGSAKVETRALEENALCEMHFVSVEADVASSLTQVSSVVQGIQVFRPVIAMPGGNDSLHVPSQRVKYSKVALKNRPLNVECSEGGSRSSLTDSTAKAGHGKMFFTLATTGPQESAQEPTTAVKTKSLQSKLSDINE